MQAGRIKVKGKSGRHHRQWLSGRNRVGRFGRRRPAAVGGMREFMFWAGPPVAPPRPLTRRGELCQRRLNVCRPFWADPPTWNPLAGAQCIFYPSRRGRGRRRRQQQRFSSNQTHARKHSEREREGCGGAGGGSDDLRSEPTDVVEGGGEIDEGGEPSEGDSRSKPEIAFPCFRGRQPSGSAGKFSFFILVL